MSLGDKFLDQILREEVGKYFTLVQLFIIGVCLKNDFAISFYILELFVKSPLSSPCLWVGFHPHPLFQRSSQSKETLLNLSMKCRNSVFHAQGSRVTIVVVQVGAVKIYVTAVEVEVLRKIERGDETQFSTKID